MLAHYKKALLIAGVIGYVAFDSWWTYGSMDLQNLAMFLVLIFVWFGLAALANARSQERMATSRILWCAVGCPVTLAGAFVLLEPQDPMPAAFQKIHKGMNETQVQNILGGPGRTYGGGLPITEWSGANYRIYVQFTKNDAVFDKVVFHKVIRENERFFTRLRKSWRL